MPEETDENVSPNSIDGNNGGLNEEYLVSVFKTDNMAIVAVVKSILDEAGIKYMAKGDNMQGVVPINAFPVDFQVMPEDEANARELISEIDEDSDWYDENSPDDSETLVTVYTTWNHALISLIKSMLDEAEIKYLAKGENFQYMEPIYAFPVEFQVMKRDEEFTRELLKDVEESIEIESPDDTEPEEDGEEN